MVVGGEYRFETAALAVGELAAYAQGRCPSIRPVMTRGSNVGQNGARFRFCRRAAGGSVAALPTWQPRTAPAEWISRVARWALTVLGRFAVLVAHGRRDPRRHQRWP